MRTLTKIKLLTVALGLWTGAAAYLVDEMRPGPPAQDVATVLKRAADLTGLDPAFLTAVAWQESRHNPTVCSKAGACGVMQLMPSVISDAGGIDVDNPVANIMTGAEHLAKLLKRYDGNRGLALAGYNWGAGNLTKWLGGKRKLTAVPKETQAYVLAITGRSLGDWLGARGVVPTPVPRPVVVAAAP